VKLYTAAKQAEGPCDITQNNDLLNLGTLNTPSGYSSLANFSIDAQMWADSHSVTVLKDIEAVANDPSSTADVATLNADSQTAVADGHLLVNQATRAATGRCKEHRRQHDSVLDAFNQVRPTDLVGRTPKF
jgi:hypothetical protein